MKTPAYLSYTINTKGLGSSLNRIGDLAYFEGPILSLFEDLKTGQLYIFDWVDTTETSNRWLVFRVTTNLIFEYINSKISYLDLFINSPDKKYYYTDITNFIPTEFDLALYDQLPEEYYPSPDQYFDIADSRNFAKIEAIIYRNFSLQKNNNELVKRNLINVKNSKLKFKGEKKDRIFICLYLDSKYTPIIFTTTNKINRFGITLPNKKSIKNTNKICSLT